MSKHLFAWCWNFELLDLKMQPSLWGLFTLQEGVQGKGILMQGIAKIISPIYGLERFWIKADLPQNLLKKSSAKVELRPCRMPLALTLQRKNPTGGSCIVRQFKCHADKWHQQRHGASREKAYAIQKCLWVLRAVRCILFRSAIKKKAHRSIARSP